jgi:hypothetical protein
MAQHFLAIYKNVLMAKQLKKKDSKIKTEKTGARVKSITTTVTEKIRQASLAVRKELDRLAG